MGRTIDMDFMNLNQAAHGDREFGFMHGAAAACNRKVVVGLLEAIRNGARDRHVDACAALGWHDVADLKVARFGDNMRNVAVTEGDKVEAQKRLRLYGLGLHGVGDLTDRMAQFNDADVATRWLSEYRRTAYTIAAELHEGAARHDFVETVAARIELGLRAFLTEGRLRRVHGYVRGSARLGAAAGASPRSG